MMERLEARGAAIAEVRAGAARADVAARLAEMLPGVAVTVEGEGVVLAAPGLGRRMLRDPALRWVAEALR